jgi:O-6-methylguanine DNA methyltransferase
VVREGRAGDSIAPSGGERHVMVRTTRARNVESGRSAFHARVIAAVRRIPAGRVATYGDVAAAAGNPRASRAVGNIMRSTSDPSVPCHRVVAAGGKLGGYGGDITRKRARLLADGIVVIGKAIRNFASARLGRRRTSR